MAPKFKNLADMRFYLYRSKSKIDMLYEQIYDSARRTRKVSLKAAVVSGEATTEDAVDDEDKLRAVERELEERQLVGTLDEPKDYVKGTMRMRWGLFDDSGTRPPDDPPLVFFGGFDSAGPLAVGLGGSSKHVEGHEGATSTQSRSSTPALVRWLLAGQDHGGPPELPGWWDMDAEEYELFGAVAMAIHYLRPPTQDLEFLAKVLSTGHIHGHEHFIGVPAARAIVGTPLYVSLAHPMPDETDRAWMLVGNNAA